MHEITPAFDFVRSYIERKKIAELGGTFEVKEMTLVEYQIMVFISNQFSMLEQKDLKKNGRSNN